MSRRPSAATVTPLLVGLFFAACDAPPPWQDAAWRPESPPQRVVLGSVLAAESLLGVLADDRVAGVHFVAADPGFSLAAAAARGLPVVGASPEDLIAARPDLVLVDAYTRAETLALLSSAGVPVVRTRDPHGFADIAENLRLLGRVTHLERELDALATQTERRLGEVRRAGAELAEWRLLSLDGALHTYGEGSLFDALATAAGARNLASEHGVGAFRKLDVEEVLAWRPDAIVLSGAAAGDGARPEWLTQWPGLELLPCVREGRLLYVPGPLLSTTSHRLVDAAAFVQRQLREWGAP